MEFVASPTPYQGTICFLSSAGRSGNNHVPDNSFLDGLPLITESERSRPLMTGQASDGNVNVNGTLYNVTAIFFSSVIILMHNWAS